MNEITMGSFCRSEKHNIEGVCISEPDKNKDIYIYDEVTNMNIKINVDLCKPILYEELITRQGIREHKTKIEYSKSILKILELQLKRILGKDNE